MRGPRNGFSREVLTFAWCARPSVWLQKSSSDVRFRQASPVAAGGAHGDSARGTKPAKAAARGEKASSERAWVATPGGAQRARERLLGGGRRPVSRKQSPFTRRQQKRHWLEAGTGLTVGEINQRHGRQRSNSESADSGVNTVGPMDGATGRSEANAVKHEASSTSLE